MTTKKASKYLKLVARLEQAEELLESLENASEAKALHIDKNLIYGTARTTPVNDGVGNITVEIEDLKERIKYLKRSVARERKALLKYADTINKEDLRIAFRMKYLNGVTWAQIAVVMGGRYTDEYLKTTIYRLFEKDKSVDK